MLNRLAVSVLLLLTIIVALQLTPASADGADICPSVRVSGLQSGAHGALFTVNVTGTNADLTYNWAISAGSIEQGQGTPTITVIDAGDPGTTVTATVEVGGLAPDCYRTDSATIEIMPPDPQ